MIIRYLDPWGKKSEKTFGSRCCQSFRGHSGARQQTVRSPQPLTNLPDCMTKDEVHILMKDDINLAGITIIQRLTDGRHDLHAGRHRTSCSSQ